MDKFRGTGRTTQQISLAPQRSIYICGHHTQLAYLRDLALHVGRGDIAFIAASNGLSSERVRSWWAPVVVDHAANLPPEIMNDLRTCHPGLVPQIV